MKNKKFWRWKNQDVDEKQTRVLELYGTIAEESWFDDDITPKMFRQELFKGSGDLEIWINSPGGDCIAASQIYAMLMDYPDHITVKIDGIAASAASVIAMAGTTVMMAPTALMMIHNPMTVAYGDHDDMQKAISMLDEVKESIINAYEIKTSLKRSEISKLMDSETWMNANKAIEMGFVDKVLEDEKKSLINNSYSYSPRKVQSTLLNKISSKIKTENKQLLADGTPIEQLEKRLNLIKPY